MNPFRVTMRTYVEDVVAVAEQIGRPSTLVAHSMGGIVASLAAELHPTRWSRIVFLSGYLAGEGRRSFRHLPTSAALRASPSKPTIRGTVVASPDAARKVFYNECDDAVVERIPTLLCPQPLRPLLANFTFTQEGLGAVPKSYIECLKDRAIEVDMQRDMHRAWPMDGVAKIDTDHMAMLTRPNEVAAAIAALAA
jgi:pimeloyl-ACP methyl ester carboxylesterase